MKDQDHLRKKINPKPRRDKFGAKKILAKDAIGAKTKEILARGSKKSRMSKTYHRP